MHVVYKFGDKPKILATSSAQICLFCLNPLQCHKDGQDGRSKHFSVMSKTKSSIKIKCCFTSTVRARHEAWCLLYHLDTQSFGLG